jgi:N-acetylgalactosamine-N,N'-diacetylbacillosaminyl-diphospho-undecaprenol 4-alpha-N-acetylgalactosaminyltransferase
LDPANIPVPPLKVLECIPSMGGGGAELQLAYLSAPLSSRGWSVVVALASGGPHFSRLAEGGAQIEWLRKAGNYDPRLVLAIRRIIEIERPDVVQSWLPQMDVIAGVAALTSGVPWVMSERSSGDAFRGTWKQRLRITLARRATAIIANSAGGARFWAARAPGVPVHVIPNGLGIEAIDAVAAVTPKGMGVSAGLRVVLAVGRCVPEKNQRLLIEAVPQLDRDIILVICGEGPTMAALRTRARELGVADRVHLAGYVPAVWGWMKSAAAFVSVGLYEGHPNAVLEAMAARCPVVVSDIEAHRDVLSRDEALFVDPSSAEDLARAITVAVNAGSTERVTRARRRAESFSLDAAGAAYDAVYRHVVSHS